MTERQRNIRADDILDRSYNGSGYNGSGYNSRRAMSHNRGDDEWNTNYPYRGNHRAESQHHADDRESERQRQSRVGRHHADYNDDPASR